MRRGAGLLVVLTLLSSACQIKPTEVRNTTNLTFQEAAAEILSKHPVILDTRAPLDFGVSHVPGAINVGWMDFTQPGAKQKGLLDPDDFALARRLALWGIDPQTPVLVIGEPGRAEPGWVAWMLRSLGVKTVNTGTPAVYRGQIPRPEMGPENKPMWKPDVRTEIRATPSEGRAFLRGPGVTGTIVTKAGASSLGVPAGAQSRRRAVLDVRTEEQRKALPLKLFGWTATTVEAPWTDFFRDGINGAGMAVLSGKGLTRNDEILVVSENGLEGGAVTYALDVLNWRVKNLDAGLRGLGVGK